jgi:hypothetical protein
MSGYAELISTPGTIWGFSALSGPDRDASTRHRHDQNAIILAERPRFEIVAERYFHGLYDGMSLRPGHMGALAGPFHFAVTAADSGPTMGES